MVLAKLQSLSVVPGQGEWLSRFQCGPGFACVHTVSRSGSFWVTPGGGDPAGLCEVRDAWVSDGENNSTFGLSGLTVSRYLTSRTSSMRAPLRAIEPFQRWGLDGDPAASCRQRLNTSHEPSCRWYRRTGNRRLTGCPCRCRSAPGVEATGVRQRLGLRRLQALEPFLLFLHLRAGIESTASRTPPPSTARWRGSGSSVVRAVGFAWRPRLGTRSRRRCGMSGWVMARSTRMYRRLCADFCSQTPVAARHGIVDFL